MRAEPTVHRRLIREENRLAETRKKPLEAGKINSHLLITVADDGAVPPVLPQPLTGVAEP